MTIEHHGETVRVFGVKELHAANGTAFQDAVKEAMTGEVRHIEIDLSGMTFLDSCGLGTLVALRKLAARREGVVRLLNPAPPTLQMLELTRLYRVLEVVKREEVAAAA
jgi:anti-sigma B factor antagonist